ncbi:hypothetical protein BG000_008555 [Podila horticola]|nr:hypothetical protein BG000_008555 [Podila horticola]
MFDIPELDQKVCSQLDLGSLAKCAQVSKKWNRVVAPSVWHTIPEDTKHHDWRELCKLVLEDLLQERQHTQQEQSSRTRRSTRAVKATSEPSETLKNTRPSTGPLELGHHIRQVQCAAQLLTGLERILDAHGLYKSTEYSSLTAQDLVLHLLKRCPNALMAFEMTNEHFNTPQKYRLALEILPRVNALIATAIYDGRKVFPVTKLKQVLTTTSEHLESLTINAPSFRACRGSAANGAKSSKSSESKMTSQPKKLKLQALAKSDSYAWLWRACGHVQELELEILANKVYTELVEAVQHSMPSLDTVTFSNYVRGGDYEVNDQRVASLLAAGTKGWRAVHCGTVARVGVRAVDAVLQYTSTLEKFSVARVQGSPGLARVLWSCPKLRVFEAMAATELDGASVPKVPVADFIEWDQESEALHRWPCKARLEALAVRITDFPLRVRLLQDGVQARDRHLACIQQQVFQRLAQFKNLRVLQLGHRADVGMKQFNCLRLTLEYGLDKLRRIKNLEELHIDNMDHRVTEVEFQWMVEHWSKLRKVSGLDQKSNASKWLKKHHPEIQQQTSN